MNGSGKSGFTMVEILVVTLLTGVLLLILFLTYRGVTTGASRGSELLNVLQEESNFLTHLRHDLRTLIMGTDPGIPAPVLENDGAGTHRLKFYKVVNVDSNGRPLPTAVEYLRSDSGKKATLPDGKTIPLYSLSRRVGQQQPHSFMRNLVASFSIDLLDRSDQSLTAPEFHRMTKARLVLQTVETELLDVTASIYSPYLPSALASMPEQCWLPNYKIREFIPGVTAVVTYQGIEIEPAALEIIPGATGIALKFNTP